MKTGIATSSAHNGIRYVLPLLLMGLFGAFLLAQHRLVFPYHDDWGLAVLDYVGEQSGFTGQQFSLGHVLDFLGGMYMNWSGRVSAFFVQIYLFRFGLEYVRLFQVAVILAIVIFSAKIPSGQTLRQPLILVPIVLYLALPSFTLAGGLYWFSAASAYVWGLPLLLWSAWLVKKHKGMNFRSTMLMTCAATFHEQMAVAAIAFFTSYVFLEQLAKFDRKALIANSLLVLPIVVFSGITLFAPGNFNRKNSSIYPADNFPEIILMNVNAISEWLTAHSEGQLFLFIMLFSLASLCLRVFIELKRRSTGVVLIALPMLLLALFYFLSALAFTCLLIVYYGLALFLLRNTHEFGRGILSVYTAAIASVAVLLIAPGVAGRALLPFYLLMFVPITFSFFQLACSRYRILAIVGILAALPFSVTSARDIYLGYNTNYPVHVVNHYKLSAASYDLMQGILPEEPVILYKLPDERYAETMPYQRPLIEKWMKKYYSLPPDFQFTWQ